MDRVLFQYRSQHLDEEAIAFIRGVIARHYEKGRSYIARAICEAWSWRQPNGKLKEYPAQDMFIGWDEQRKRKHLHLVVNNVRFLILPWVHVEHLASKILAMGLKHVSGAWQQVYGHPVYLAETFVDTSRYAGTCYRASNRRYVGQTKGSAKRGNSFLYHGRPKAIYLYPLHRDFRRMLCHETG